MARQFRLHSLDIYDKLGMKKVSWRKKSAFIKDFLVSQSDPSTLGEGFYITQSKSQRTKSSDIDSIKPLENSPVNFDKQTPRPDFMIHALSVHDNRFVSYNDCPPSSTRHKRITTPKFSLYLGRRQKPLTTDSKDYSPNYSISERDTTKGLIPFGKTQGRIEINRPTTSSEHFTSVDFSKLDPKVSSPLIEKSSSRKLNSNLPLFMVNFVNRGKNISLKSLKMNGYMEGQFMPLSSTFGKA